MNNSEQLWVVDKIVDNVQKDAEYLWIVDRISDNVVFGMEF